MIKQSLQKSWLDWRLKTGDWDEGSSHYHALAVFPISSN